jgi:hypothetical protein
MADSNPTRSRDAPDRQKVAHGQVVQDLINDPLTIFPVAGGIVAAGALVLIATNPVTLALAIGGVALGAGNFIWKYFTSGEDRIQEKMKAMLAAEQDQEDNQVLELKKLCEQLAFAEGAQAAGAFAEAYRNINGYLKDNEGRAGLGSFRVLAQGANRETIGKLEEALELHKALQAVNLQQVVREQQQKKVQRAGITDPLNPTAVALDRQIEAYEQTMTVYRQKCQELADRLAVLSEIQSAMQTSYLRLVSLGTAGSDDAADTELLSNAVEASERLAGLDTTESERAARRAKYLKRAQPEDLVPDAVPPVETKAEAATRREREQRKGGGQKRQRDTQRE